MGWGQKRHSLEQLWGQKYHYLRAGWDFATSIIAGTRVEKKRKAELAYWKLQKAKEGDLSSDHFEYFYTEHFGLDPEFYEGKRILDVGSGPRDPLNWATMATEAVGLDPLMADYESQDITGDSTMTRIAGRAEDVPFPDSHFDVVTSFNSLDHVDDVSASIREIKRVTRPGGLFLLITDVNHEPTVTEPVSYEWDVVEEFTPEFELLDRDCREKSEETVYSSIRFGDPYDFEDDTPRYGVLSAKFERAEG